MRQSGPPVSLRAAVDILFCEQGIKVLEGLELQRVARWIQEEHGGLFAGLTLEAHIGLDHELGAGILQLLGQGFPDRHFEHCAKMTYRRSDARRVGKGWVSMGRSRGSP